MNFEEALKALKEGEKVTRKNEIWKDDFLVLVQDDECESIELFDNDGWCDCDHPVSNIDLLAEDWEII